MSKMWWRGALLLSLLPAALVAVGGCSKDAPSEQAKGKATTPEAKKADDSGTWWCKEHGIPEHECLTCLHTEAELKKKGDWCAEHEFAKSQCFKCDPSLREKYAAKYRAKYGKEPPPMEEEKGEPKK
jgi:hypothetical protein